MVNELLCLGYRTTATIFSLDCDLPSCDLRNLQDQYDLKIECQRIIRINIPREKEPDHSPFQNVLGFCSTATTWLRRKLPVCATINAYCMWCIAVRAVFKINLHVKRVFLARRQHIIHSLHIYALPSRPNTNYFRVASEDLFNMSNLLSIWIQLSW